MAFYQENCKNLLFDISILCDIQLRTSSVKVAFLPKLLNLSFFSSSSYDILTFFIPRYSSITTSYNHVHLFTQKSNSKQNSREK